MDRKAWIVIVLCCLGLAVNFHYGAKNREALEKEHQRQAAEQVKEEKEKGKKKGKNKRKKKKE